MQNEKLKLLNVCECPSDSLAGGSGKSGPSKGSGKSGPTKESGKQGPLKGPGKSGSSKGSGKPGLPKGSGKSGSHKGSGKSGHYKGPNQPGSSSGPGTPGTSKRSAVNMAPQGVNPPRGFKEGTGAGGQVGPAQGSHVKAASQGAVSHTGPKAGNTGLTGGALSGTASASGEPGSLRRKKACGSQKAKARKLRLEGKTFGQSAVPPTQGEPRPAGTKRPRSEGSTPGAGGTAGHVGKKPRNSGNLSYGQAAAAGLRVAIVMDTYPETMVSESQYKAINTAMNAAIDGIVNGPFPDFRGFSWTPQGSITVNCGNQWTLEWLEKTVAVIKPWDGASLKVQRHIPKVIKMTAVFHGLPEETATILERLHRQNPDLRTNLWRNYFRKEEPLKVLLALGVDKGSFEALRRLNMTASAGTGYVTFVSKSATQKKPEEGAEAADATCHAAEGPAVTVPDRMEEDPPAESELVSGSEVDSSEQVADQLAQVEIVEMVREMDHSPFPTFESEDSDDEGKDASSIV